MELTGKKAVFLGDSITEGLGLPKEVRGELVYHNLLAKKCRLREAKGYGIGGTCISRRPGTSPEESNSFVDRYEIMDDDADIVVVFGGTNDYGHGNAPIGTFEGRHPITFYGACHTLMSGLIAKYPESTIVFLTPLHRDDEGDVTREPLDLYVKVIKEVAEYYAIPVLDLYANSGIQPCHPVIREKYCPDGLHPNEAGHEILASRLEGFLKML